ncbi:hypothetical protein LJB42_002265 [Komagataella kurtzmanii]|nr:hypothetical protein LJB42_002265 [Komagataella kurtzmanii]
MSQRKLQQEIDRVFKKVKEGLEEFDYVYDKLQACEISSQKEKLESDLKREIKKLQRSRDQIKIWLAGNEVKEKKGLMEHRKLIEHEMERFKEVEKEMKTKAFSKEGLNMNKVDPREKEKSETSKFVESMIEELERQSEALEAQIDQIQSSGKRGKKLDNSKTDQIAELQSSLDRNNWHQEKLQTILRLLQNGNLEADQIQRIQEDIEYYVESNQDADFAEDDGIYDELGLDEIEDGFLFAAASGPLSKDEEGKDENDENVSDNESPSASASSNFAAVNQGSTSDSTVKTAPAAINSSTGSVSNVTSTNSNASVLLNKLTRTSPARSAAATPPHSHNELTGIQSNLKPAVAPVLTPKLKYSKVASTAATASVPPGSTKVGSSTHSTTPTATTAATAHPVVSSSSLPSDSLSSTTTHPNGLDAPTSESSLKIANNLIANLDGVKKECLNKPIKKTPEEMDNMYQLLNSSLLNCPDSFDADVPNMYIPRQPHPTHISFPQEPLLEIMNSAKILQNFDLETLFYCFYYHSYENAADEHKVFDNSGSFLQINTAKELHRRGWKYHKELKTWFLLNNDEANQTPPPIEEHVQQKSNWKYFDYQETWLPRRKDDFTFEKDKLETLYL